MSPCYYARAARQCKHGAALLPSLLAVLALLLVSCGGAGPQPAAARPDAPPDLAALPRPGDVTKSADYNNANRTLEASISGASFNGRVAPSGSNMVFSPVWSSSGVHAVQDIAVAGYWFNVPDYNDVPTIELGWVTPPSTSNLWVGIANWSTNEWEWYRPVANVVTLAGLAPYQGLSGLLVAVVVLGTLHAELDWVRLGPVLWHLEVVDSAGDVGWYSSLDLDSADNPHIAYYDADNGALKYARYDGSSWHLESVDTEGDSGKFASLRLDSSNHPHIAYYDQTNGDLQYGYYDGAVWQLQTVTSAGNAGYGCCLALTSTGQPRIGYVQINEASAKYASYDGVTWNFETLGACNVTDTHISIALDAADLPHMTYGNGTVQVYVYNDGVNWIYETVSTLSHFSDGERTLALDSLGEAHMLLYDINNATLSYASRNAGTWAEEAVPVPNLTGTNGSLALTAGDEPRYSCYGPRLEYIEKTAASWQITATTNTGGAWDTSLQLDSHGYPCFSFYEPDNKDLCFVRYSP